MRRITVNAHEVALVMKRQRLVEVLTEGSYWIGFNKSVKYYSTADPVDITDQWMLMLERSELKQMLRLVRVSDHELGVETKQGLFSRLINPGLYGYWKSAVQYEVQVLDRSSYEIKENLPGHLLHQIVAAHYMDVHRVEANHVGMLYVDGGFIEQLEAGTYHYWRTEKTLMIKMVDCRIRQMNINGQEILTKDKAGIRVNFTAQYQVYQMEKAVLEAKDYEAQMHTSIQLLLREYIGKMTLDQLLADKESVGPYIVKAVETHAALLGLVILSAGIKDVILPGDVKEIMNEVLLAQKKAQANTIMRQEETASTRSLLNTAKLMDDNAMLLKLKEMEYMEKIADRIGELTVNGGGQVMDQLRELMISKA